MDRCAQYTIDGRLVVVWDSVSEAAAHINVSKSGISRACRGELVQCGGFRWAYAEDEPAADIGEIQSEFLYGIMTAGLETLGKWRTIRSAARDLGIDSSRICKVVNRKRFSWDGVMFVWAETVDDARIKCINQATAWIKR